MIKSEVKKKIEASATITNTMMVVMVVSRRVGQVTLAVSERTSCKNLNGLKAIVFCDPRSQTIDVLWNPNRPLAPSPLLKDEPPSELDCWGNSKPRRISVKTGRQQVAAMYCRQDQRSRSAGTRLPRLSSSAPHRIS